MSSKKSSESPASSPESTAAVAVAVVKPRRATTTFVLHHPGTLEPLGHFVAACYREAALKACSRGHCDILLRRTGTKKGKRFKGFADVLEKPKEVMRGERRIVFTKKPNVKLVGAHEFSSARVARGTGAQNESCGDAAE
jgi:hypothetical protein